MLWVPFYKLFQSFLIDKYIYLLVSVGSFLRFFRLMCMVNLKMSLICCERLFEGSKAVEVLVVYPMILGLMNDQGWSFNPDPRLLFSMFSLIMPEKHLEKTPSFSPSPLVFYYLL